MAVWGVRVEQRDDAYRVDVVEDGAYRTGVKLRADAGSMDAVMAVRMLRARVIGRLGDEAPEFFAANDDARPFVEMLNA